MRSEPIKVASLVAGKDADLLKGKSLPILYLFSGAFAVLAVYSLPFVLSRLRQDPFPYVAVSDEKIYLARVADAYRGGTLRNPYLAEYQHAEQFMPELGERLLASVAHAAGVAPLRVVAVSRVLFPICIYLILWSLARALEIEPRLAMLAAMLPPLAPTISWLGAPVMDALFERYFRAISPGLYVLLLALALRTMLWAWQETSWRAAVLAGVSLGVLFYTPPYYWSFTFLATVWLAIIARGRQRTAMLIPIAMALLLACPSLAGTLHRARAADVQAVLVRQELLTPGRTPDAGAPRIFLVGVLMILAVWLGRRALGATARFLLPFLCVGTFLTVQNVVTNRHLQSNHWVECLIPVWALAAVALLQLRGRAVSPTWQCSLAVILFAGAMAVQTGAFLAWERWQKESPEFWALDARMPRTLLWLNRNTPANSVVLANPDIMDSLVLFTHNKVYWAAYADQHAIPDREVQARTKSLDWRPGHLPFRVDFFLGTGPEC